MPTQRRLDPATVRRIRTSTESDVWWARKLTAEGTQISRESIRQVRAGVSYRHLLEDGDAAGGGSCERCLHWRGLNAAEPCDLGHRDPLADGLGFARICPTFARAKRCR